MSGGTGGSGGNGAARSGAAARLVSLLGLLIPEADRVDWVREWEAELDAVGSERDGRGGGLRAVARLTAAAEDAVKYRLRRGVTPPADALREFRLAARALARAPLFTVMVVVTLAVGVGANAALFAVIKAALLEPLPYPTPERLVTVGTRWTETGNSTQFVSTADYDDLASRLGSVEAPAFRASGAVTYQADEPIRLSIAGVSSSYFRLFGTRAHVGRYLQPDDDEPGRAVAVLSYGAWQGVFGGDAGVVGRTMVLDGQPHVVVGVAEPGLRDPSADVALWTSRPGWIDVARRDQPWLEVFGRISPNATLADVHAEVAGVSRDLAREFPATNTGHVLTVESLRETITGPVRAALLVVAAVVMLVLAITCANVANLVLVRSTGRGREMAVRLSLGAGRMRLASQLVAEGLLLAMVGGALGLAFAAGATQVFGALGAPGLPRLADVRLDGAVLSFTLLLSGFTGIVFGLTPLLQVSGANPSSGLRQSGRGGESRRVKRVRRALVVAEVAGSAVLLVGAGLLVRSLVHLSRTETGVITAGVLTFQVAPSQRSRAELRDFYDRALEGISRLPGVEAAGGISVLPFTGIQMYPIRRDDRPPEPGEQTMADVRALEPGYFAVVGIPLTGGRMLDDRDAGNAPPVAVVDETFAQAWFPDEDPLGRRITIDWSGGVEAVSYEIVGLVGPVHQRGPASPPSPAVYLHRGHESMPYWVHFAHTITVRTRGEPVSLAREASNVVWSIDRTVPITEVGPFDRLLDRHMAGTRYRMLLIGAFAVLATLLAAVGIGGIVAYAVAQRGRELGIRQALGAAPADIVRSVTAEGVRLAVAGLVVGLVLAVFGTRLMRSFLFGVDVGDPITYACVAFMLGAIATASSWIPARRATRVRPADVLRGEA